MFKFDQKRKEKEAAKIAAFKADAAAAMEIENPVDRILALRDVQDKVSADAARYRKKGDSDVGLLKSISFCGGTAVTTNMILSYGAVVGVTALPILLGASMVSVLAGVAYFGFQKGCDKKAGVSFTDLADSIGHTLENIVAQEKPALLVADNLPKLIERMPRLKDDFFNATVANLKAQQKKPTPAPRDGSVKLTF